METTRSKRGLGSLKLLGMGFSVSVPGVEEAGRR